MAKDSNQKGLRGNHKVKKKKSHVEQIKFKISVYQKQSPNK